VPDLIPTVPSQTLYNLGPTEVHTIAVFSTYMDLPYTILKGLDFAVFYI
jgi:hypothetical protein